MSNGRTRSWRRTPGRSAFHILPIVLAAACGHDPPEFAHQGPEPTVLTCQENAGSSAIAGRVTNDSTHLPLHRALVSLQRTRCRTTSDSAGRYTIGGLPAGLYAMRAEFIGTAAGSADVNIGAADTVRIDFSLRPVSVHIGGCDPARLNDSVPTEVVPLNAEERLHFIQASPIHGWECQLRSRRLRIAADTAAVAYYADLLMGSQRLDGPWYRWVALKWVAEADDPQYVPVFLRYATSTWAGSGDSAPGLFYAAIDGLARHAEGDETARNRLFQLTTADLEPRASHAVATHIARVNGHATREWLERRLDDGIVFSFADTTARRWLSSAECEAGTVLNLDTLECESRGP